METQITNYISPIKKMNTEYGLVSGEVWLQKEMKRISANKNRVYIKEIDSKDTAKEGFIALFRNNGVLVRKV